ncbi:hypothetical protein Aph01nite_75950 [Acrocarpospora phusangensis]|uniref:Peptidase M48 domain-containing protein n=1 Tax=Acrocarpospora phusangensis TaxID=1070424 RepID=A0A919UVC5_9ACTN|nr:M48 family metallopeptidase [Acrocarpospora phusangensis]GIH29285.1 hypothetical protein Aph01nite_75950 [Acrocarpospora phusangensis]
MIGFARAALSLILLAGFFVVAIGQVAGAIALTVLISDVIAGFVAVKLLWPLVAASAVGTGRAVWRVFRGKPEPPTGLRIADPWLTQTVERLARQADTRPPDEIWLTPEVNASVTEESRLLGLLGGTRRLMLGLPVLHAFTVAELEAVIAHELGHYSGGDTRLAAISYRGRLAIAAALHRMSPRNPVSWIFRGYGALYLLADNAVSRRQELAADRAAVLAAGKEATSAALSRLPGLSVAWEFFHDAYVMLGWQHGYVPQDVFGGFAAMAHARAEDIAALQSALPEERGSRWDTHPPLPVRLAAIRALPDVRVQADHRPAYQFVAGHAELTRALAEQVVDAGDRTPLPWPQYTATALAAGLQDDVDRDFRAIARALGGPAADLSTVVDQIAAGRLAEIAQPLFPTATRRELPELFAVPLTRMFALAAVRSGVAGYRHSWSGPAEFVTGDGADPRLDEIAELAVRPGGLGEAMARLTRMGVHVAAGTQRNAAPTAVGASVIGGLANVKVDGKDHDVIILTAGLVLVPEPGRINKGRLRMLDMVNGQPADKLAQSYPFLAYETVQRARVLRSLPLKAELSLYDGRTVELRERLESEELGTSSRDDLISILENL